MAEENVTMQTIKTYLAAVRSMQISLGLPDPQDQSSLPMLKHVQAGIHALPIIRWQLNPSSVDISWGDVAVNDLAVPTMLKVHLSRSQFGKGVDIYVAVQATSYALLLQLRLTLLRGEICPAHFFAIRTASHPLTKTCFIAEMRTGAWSGARCGTQF